MSFELPRPPYRAVVLKDEPRTRLELITTADHRVARKIYRSRPFLLWRTFLQSSRGAREFHNLDAVQRAGVPCVTALSWDEVRVRGCVLQSEVTTELVPLATPLRDALAADPPVRRELVTEAGGLLRRLHRSGFLSCCMTPRNVLVRPGARNHRLLLCDLPTVVRFGDSILGRRVADVDVYDMAFSARRTQELSHAERYRLLLAYADGDRAVVRGLWRRLSSRSRRAHRAIKAMWIGWEFGWRLPLRAMAGGRAYLSHRPQATEAER